jgi:hypothetical protein
MSTAPTGCLPLPPLAVPDGTDAVIGHNLPTLMIFELLYLQHLPDFLRASAKLAHQTTFRCTSETLPLAKTCSQSSIAPTPHIPTPPLHRHHSSANRQHICLPENAKSLKFHVTTETNLWCWLVDAGDWRHLRTPSPGPTKTHLQIPEACYC